MRRWLFTVNENGQLIRQISNLSYLFRELPMNRWFARRGMKMGSA